MIPQSVRQSPGTARCASELRIVIGQLVRRLRAEHTFPIAHATVLGRLERDGPQTTSALASAEHVRPQSMAQTIDQLRADRLVSRRPDPGDGRQMFIELTTKGRRILAAEQDRRDTWLAQAIESELTADEQEIVIRAVPLLQRLSQL
jgi:DNA-binding MarR family transcriptional regulator